MGNNICCVSGDPNSIDPSNSPGAMKRKPNVKKDLIMGETVI